MEKPQWANIIYHQTTLQTQEKGLFFNSLTQKEQYQLMYEIALDLLCELGNKK